MPNVATAPQPDDAVFATEERITRTIKAQVYPTLEGTSADRPASGQLWPRGTFRSTG